jgi:hypothetical protein
MPCKFFWLNEQTTVYFELINEFNQDEFYDYCQTLHNEFLEKSKEVIHLIIDTQGLNHTDEDLARIRHIASSFNTHPKLGDVIFLGEHPISQLLADDCFPWYQINTVRTLEGVIQILNNKHAAPHA